MSDASNLTPDQSDPVTYARLSRVLDDAAEAIADDPYLLIGAVMAPRIAPNHTFGLTGVRIRVSPQDDDRSAHEIATRCYHLIITVLAELVLVIPEIADMSIDDALTLVRDKLASLDPEALKAAAQNRRTWDGR